MTTDETDTDVITIGQNWLTSQLEDAQDAAASQVGQAMHYLSLGRTRDARLHIEQIMPQLYKHHDALVKAMFAP